MGTKLNGGKPKFALDFEERAAIPIGESPRGILGVLLFDETKSDFEKKEYYSSVEIKDEDWTEDNIKLLKSMAFRGAPFKVIAYRGTNSNVTDILKIVEQDEPNYFVCPVLTGGIQPEDLATDLESWINSLRNVETIKLGNNTSTIKYVSSCSAGPDKPWIIDYDSRQSNHILYGFEDKTYTAQEYALCIASMCAGVVLNSSITNMAQPWLKSMKTTVDDVDTAVGDGKLVNYYNGKEYCIVRGVNSFKTATDTMNSSFCKIRIMEIMDLNQKDIREVFCESYRGKYQNFYENKMKFLSAVNAYLAKFVKRGQLDPANENKMVIDIEATRNWLIGQGTLNGKPLTEEQAKKLTPYQLMRANTKDILFAYIPDYKPTDVMEDFFGKAIM